MRSTESNKRCTESNKPCTEPPTTIADPTTFPPRSPKRKADSTRLFGTQVPLGHESRNAKCIYLIYRPPRSPHRGSLRRRRPFPPASASACHNPRRRRSRTTRFCTSERDALPPPAPGSPAPSWAPAPELEAAVCA